MSLHELPTTSGLRRRNEAGGMGHAIGWVVLILGLLGLLLTVAVFTFSVGVQGRSMNPTVKDGDRVVINVLDRDDLARFDVVEAAIGEGHTSGAIKRVIGLPGDRVSVTLEDGLPVVRVRPAGEKTTYVVENPSWTSQPGGAGLCCTKDGKASTDDGHFVKVPENHYWLIGDNWGGSDDSRRFGFIDAQYVGGTVSLRLQSDFGWLENPARLAEDD